MSAGGRRPSPHQEGVAGEPAEYDTWRALGNPGWGYDEVLPYLQRVESYARGDASVRGTGGPVHINLFGRNTLGDAFHTAWTLTERWCFDREAAERTFAQVLALFDANAAP